LLGRFEPTVEPELTVDPSAARARINAMAGEAGLMMFDRQNHGALLALVGKKAKAKRYFVGNPLIAIQMTQHDIRAGLYAPLSVLVYEIGPTQTRVEFDRPSSLFGQFEKTAVTEVALGLDAKLMTVTRTLPPPARNDERNARACAPPTSAPRGLRK
jgi:uncharacterized protein (DUF302 family)